MAELAELRNVNVQAASWPENAEKKLIDQESKSTLLGACKNCPFLAKDVELKDKRLKELESRLESVGCSKDVQLNYSTCTTTKLGLYASPSLPVPNGPTVMTLITTGS